MDEHDRLKIKAELARIEEEENVRILYACESGSRAWGFPSKDSDYDVRFLYVRPAEWYLSIRERRDVIERPISGMLDINGWDLRKALALFSKSNPPLLEWLRSPIRYLEPYAIAERIRAYSAATFSPKSCMFHYLHMARGNYREYLQGDTVRAKKYFYVLRPLLACGWIEKYREMPPVPFEELAWDLIPADSELYDIIQRLLARKRAGDELRMEPRIGLLNDYLEERIDYFEQAAKQLDAAAGVADEQLDELFRDALLEAWGKVSV
ncbi:nucleotidyltransferase domain-containing protein [Paenibacillus glycanilyticus]|uniref:nucleotidyltransferase domain-containing protein n=1 Tax=Paenibacillus glycanilyticus TaxID=126569 RepID=UPI0020401521|nr:nucleotidyltransferase domain-containing protein [Paenibacillus glycanilyticus]MCM3629362.1 nucleotidyltransferase domain-containing protein [Paenibacillus glycanilyticus]